MKKTLQALPALSRLASSPAGWRGSTEPQGDPNHSGDIGMKVGVLILLHNQRELRNMLQSSRRSDYVEAVCAWRSGVRRDR